MEDINKSTLAWIISKQNTCKYKGDGHQVNIQTRIQVNKN